MSKKLILNVGFILEVTLFILTGYVLAYRSPYFLIPFIFGLGWAYRVGKWIEERAIDKENDNQDFVQRILDEIKRENEKKMSCM